MRYLGLAIAILFLAMTLGTAFAGPPKAGDIVETIYACKSEEVLDFVLTRETVEEFNWAADAGVESGDCLVSPGNAKVMAEVQSLRKQYNPKWSNLIVYSFTTTSGGQKYYTFSWEARVPTQEL